LQRANFLLLPWMVFICMLTPLFMIAIIAGTRVIREAKLFLIPEHALPCRVQFQA
jgi:hypothetical protein